MHKALHNLPVFDRAGFSETANGWKTALKGAGPGGNRMIVEWSTSRGPSCFVFPAAKRGTGINLTSSVPHTQSDERWADFLEHEFIPPVVQALKDEGFASVQVNCVDLRPVQAMRARRRTIESVAQARTGDLAHEPELAKD